MNEYVFEMVPGLVGRIAELLESIDSKLDKVNVTPIPTDDRTRTLPAFNVVQDSFHMQRNNGFPPLL